VYWKDTTTQTNGGKTPVMAKNVVGFLEPNKFAHRPPPLYIHSNFLTMAYKVVDIEGIGPTYAEKLGNLGVHTTADLLEKGATKKGRIELAAQTGIPESLILTWVNHADLFRIKGVAGQFSELLEAAGVDSVKEFATRKAENLHAKLLETNDKFGLSGRVPSVESLQEMITQAKGMDAVISH